MYLDFINSNNTNNANNNITHTSVSNALENDKETTPPEESIKIWTSKETMLFLDLYKENISELENSFKTKKLMWKALSKALQSKGVNATPQQCSSKYKNLSSTFRKKIDESKRSGAASVRPWVFMDLMMDINGMKDNVDPNNLENFGMVSSDSTVVPYSSEPGTSSQKYRDKIDS